MGVSFCSNSISLSPRPGCVRVEQSIVPMPRNYCIWTARDRNTTTIPASLFGSGYLKVGLPYLPKLKSSLFLAFFLDCFHSEGRIWLAFLAFFYHGWQDFFYHGWYEFVVLRLCFAPKCYSYFQFSTFSVFHFW